MNKRILLVVLLGLLAATLWMSWPHRASVPSADRGAGGKASEPPPPPNETVSSREVLFARPLSPSDPLYSQWVADEKLRYRALLGTKPCNILVVPAQTLQYGFDRATRSLMTAQLARAIARATSDCVVDPYLASRALGVGMRQIDTTDVYALARQAGVARMVIPRIGHDGKGELTVVLEARSLVLSGSTFTPPLRKVYVTHISDEVTPMSALDALLPDMLRALGFKAAAAKSLSVDDALTLPDDPVALLANAGAAPLQTALRYQLLGALSPAADRETEELFEKSWLAADDAVPSAAQSRIQARALLHLRYRMPALQLIKSDQSEQATLLRELLNGNLSRAEAALQKINAPLEAVLGSVEVVDLGWAYGHRDNGDPMPAALQALNARSPGWAVIVMPRANDANQWNATRNLGLQAYLDKVFPVASVSLNSAVTSALVWRSPRSDGDDLVLPIKHFKQRLLDNAAALCCATFDVQPAEIDLLQWLQARALRNAESVVRLSLDTQGLPEDAMETLDLLDAQYAGHPHLSAQRAKAYGQLLERQPNERAGERSRSREQAARLSLYWEQEWTPYAIRAVHQAKADFTAAYTFDLPPRLYNADNYQLGFSWSINDTSFVSQALLETADENKQRQIREVFNDRFLGSPNAAGMQLVAPKDPYDDAAMLAYAKNLADRQPDNDTYALDFIRRLVRAERYDDAVAAAKAMPGMKPDRTGNPVRASNNANAVASYFFWRGDLARAQAFYKLAADNDDGSHSSMLAQQRMHLFDGDFAGVAAMALRRMQRYEVSWGALDYMCLLFAAGASEPAFALFNEAIGRYKESDVWFAVLVGHRVNGASDEDVQTWLMRPSIRAYVEKPDRPALLFALQYFLIDHRPNPNLPSIMARLEGKPLQAVEMDGYSVIMPAEHGFHTFQPSAFRRDVRTARPAQTAVPAPEVLFATALAAQQRGDDAAAIVAFDALAASYAIESATLDFTIAMPYFARSAALGGDTLKFEPFLDTSPAVMHDFDYELARAVFDGVARRHDSALAHLRRASDLGPQSEHLLLSAFELADTCIWLYERTRDDRYREMALDWARKYERMEPTFAWAYALDARYAPKNDPLRVRAIGIADFLDRQSNWLKGTDKADLEKGRSWMRANNPFKGGTKHSSGTAI